MMELDRYRIFRVDGNKKTGNNRFSTDAWDSKNAKKLQPS